MSVKHYLYSKEETETYKIAYSQDQQNRTVQGRVMCLVIVLYCIVLCLGFEVQFIDQADGKLRVVSLVWNKRYHSWHYLLLIYCALTRSPIAVSLITMDIRNPAKVNLLL